LLAHVVSLNLFRRHLTVSQRALLGARLKPKFEAEAKARQANSTGGASPQLSANLREAEKGKASGQAAAAVEVIKQIDPGDNASRPRRPCDLRGRPGTTSPPGWASTGL